jgi:glycerol-3-phosphate dehydrogenase
MDANSSDHLNIYGSDAQFIRALINKHEDLRQTLHPAFPNTYAEVIWAVRNEMARTVEDILARRLRILFLNAHVAIEMAPKVAALVAGELRFDREWQRKQVEDFTLLASNYLLESKQESKHHVTVL